jgi:hypothetical protein
LEQQLFTCCEPHEQPSEQRLPAVQRQSFPHLQLAQLPSARQPQFDPGVQGQAPGAQVQVDLAATFAAAWVSHLQPAVQRLPAVQRQSSPHLQLAQLPSARQPQFDPGVQGHAPGWHEHDAFATVAALATAPHAALQHSPSVQSHAPGGQVQFAQQAPAVFDSAPPRGATVRKANPANANTPEAISLVNMAYLHLLSGNTEIRWRCGQNAPDQPPWLFNTDNVLNSQRRRWINRARSPARPAGDCGCREGVRLKDAQATPRSPHRQKRRFAILHRSQGQQQRGSKRNGLGRLADDPRIGRLMTGADPFGSHRTASDLHRLV